MLRIQVTNFLRDALVGMRDSGCDDVHCSFMKYDDEQIAGIENPLSLEATCEYLETIAIEAGEEDPDSLDELEEIDWPDFAPAIDLLRSYRLIGNWETVKKFFADSLQRWLPEAPFAFERLSLWDLILHTEDNYVRMQEEGSGVALFTEDGNHTINALVNGGVPAQDDLRQVVHRALEFLNNALIDVEQAPTFNLETEPDFSGDYEFISEEDQPPQLEEDLSEPTGNPELECLQELCGDLEKEWELFQSVYSKQDQ